jgi:hypothetical protein
LPPGIIRSGPTEAKPSVDIFRQAALFLPAAPMRNSWLKVFYLVAIAIATIGWLWFIVWIVFRLF